MRIRTPSNFNYLDLLCFYGIYSTLDIVVGMMSICYKSN